MQVARVELLADGLKLGAKSKPLRLVNLKPEEGKEIEIVRFIQIDIHLFATRVPLGSHDVLDVIEERVETFVHNQARFLLSVLQLLILILPNRLAGKSSAVFWRNRLEAQAEGPTLTFLFSFVSSRHSFSSLSFIVTVLLRSDLPLSWSFCS